MTRCTSPPRSSPSSLSSSRFSALSRRYGFPAPLVLTLVGLARVVHPGRPGVRAQPRTGPGRLPAAAAVRRRAEHLADRLPPQPSTDRACCRSGWSWSTSWSVGFVVWWLLPVDAWAAFALGAVVAPPDAVAATAIARRVGMPRRMVTILQGESLVNDATALVVAAHRHRRRCSRRRSLSALEISWDFVTTAVGGVVGRHRGRLRHRQGALSTSATRSPTPRSR